MENGLDLARADSSHLGRAKRIEDAPGRYIEYVKKSFPAELRLDGLKIGIDCAHGAAYKVAPTVLFELGATVVPMGVAPDGFNINRKCGATAPDELRNHVVMHGCDIGIALDGDADRVVLVDEQRHGDRRRPAHGADRLVLAQERRAARRRHRRHRHVQSRPRALS